MDEVEENQIVVFYIFFIFQINNFRVYMLKERNMH